MSSSSPALHPSWSPPPSSTFSLTGSTSPTSPMYPTLESQFCDRERDKIEAVAQQMQRCQHATDQMLSILSSFESKLTALETTMLPIHKGTQPLTTAQKNIDLSITETEKVISNYHVATESEEQIAERSISSDYQSYIAWVERINTALLFFQKNTTFKNQDRYVRKLRDLLKRAMLECEREFARLLDTNSRILDLERVGWPLPSNLELIPSGTLSQLTSIASCMSGSHNTSYIDLLKDRRRITLKKSFKAAIAWHDTVRQTSHPQDTWIHTPNIEERTITNTAAIGELKVGRYERGTHRGVFHIRIFARLCELEHLLLTSLLSHTSHSSYSEFDDTYSHIIGAALDKFMKEQAETLKETATVGPNKLLIALDMLENLNQTLPRYRAVFNKNSDFNRMLDFQDRVRDICRRSIMEYVTYVSTTSKDVNKNKSKDGTIHTITIETLNYLKRLHDYHTTIDGIPKADIHQPTTTDIPIRVTSLSITHTTNAQATATSQNHIHEQHENESMTHLTGIILTALETNLTSRARGYKLDSLSAIFLLNNFHYIAKQLKKSDLDPGRQYTARYDALVLEAREQYKSASWDRLLSFIDLSDAATLLKRVPAAAAAAMSAVAALTTSPTMTTASLAGVTVPTTPSATTSTSHTLITVPKQVRKQIKAKYHGFNIEFQELHSTQTHFSVPDSDLRSQLRNHNVELIVNTYRHFNAMFSEVDFSTHRTKYIKYSPQVLETMINQFFDEQA